MRLAGGERENMGVGGGGNFEGVYFEPLREAFVVKFVATHAQSIRKTELISFMTSLNVLRHPQLRALIKRLQANPTLRLVGPAMSANNSRRIY